MTWLDRVHAAVEGHPDPQRATLNILVAALANAESDGVDIDDLLDRQRYMPVPRLEGDDQ